MNQISKTQLLKNREAVEEIKRHLWIESEKAGYDIGFDKAADDWIKNYAKAWVRHHMPKRRVSSGNRAAKLAKQKTPASTASKTK